MFKVICLLLVSSLSLRSVSGQEYNQYYRLVLAKYCIKYDISYIREVTKYKILLAIDEKFYFFIQRKFAFINPKKIQKLTKSCKYWNNVKISSYLHFLRSKIFFFVK